MTDRLPADAVYPDLTIYASRDEASGKLVPIAVGVGGISLPVLRAAIVADPNGRTTGTQALVGEIAFPIGGGGLEIVDGPEDVPDLSVFTAA